MRLNRYIGIDPGSNGGYAVLGPGNYIAFGHLPATELGVLDLMRDLASAAGLHCCPDVHAVIEEIPTAIFGTSKSSMSKLYGNYMSLRMALLSAGIPFSQEKAVVWQRAMGVEARVRRGPKKETEAAYKRRLKRTAARMYPRLLVTLATADALLLAEYCRRMYEPPA